VSWSLLPGLCYANFHEATRWASTLGQAVGSFFGGYLVAASVEYTFGVTRKPWRFPLAALGPYAITLMIYALIHAVIGTPDILKTIMPNIIIGTTYFLLYVVKLERDAPALISGGSLSG